MHATKGCKHQEDACNKEMQAPRRCMQQGNAGTKEMHAIKRHKLRGDACNKEMQAPWRYMQQRDASSKDAGTKRCRHQRDARSKISKRCMRPKDARVAPHVRVQ